MANPRVLPEFRVFLERVAENERVVDDLEYPEALGRRTKLGGKPDWIQNDATPNCSDCGEPTAFIAQIDSIEHNSRHNPLRRIPETYDVDYMFADVGMIYVFYCYDCCRPMSLLQC